MKLKQILPPLIALVALYLSACQKDFTPGDIIARIDSTATPAIGDSVYLDKYYFIESETIGVDTASKVYYQYDNLKRVITIIDTSNEPNVPFPIWFDKTNYFYNGSDTLPYKEIAYIDVVGGPSPRKDTINRFFTYDINGQLVLDSTIKSSKGISTIGGNTIFAVTKYIYKYSYSANKIFNFGQVTNLQNPNGIGLQYTTIDTATLDATGNVLSVNSMSINNTMNTPPSFVWTNFIYDNKPSPISNQNIKKLYTYNYLGDKYYNIETGFTPFNNILKINQSYTLFVNGNTSLYFRDYDYSNIYTYYPNGFPSFTFINYPAPPAYSSKQIFIYKAL